MGQVASKECLRKQTLYRETIYYTGFRVECIEPAFWNQWAGQVNFYLKNMVISTKVFSFCGRMLYNRC
jgi:hypothetical protein